MGWSIGYDEVWKRDIGYGVVALCDYPECNKEIDRGLSYVCANEEPRGGDGCGLYFCGKHHNHWRNIDDDDDALAMCCERCAKGEKPFPAKPDLPLWTFFKKVDPSWKKWRKKEGIPEPTPEMFAKMTEYYQERGWGNYDPEDL